MCAPIAEVLANGKNRSALVIYLTDGTTKVEACRVGFTRQNTKHPDVSFADQLQDELAKALKCEAVINEFEQELAEQRTAAVEATRKRVQEIMGKRTTVPA